MYSWFFDAALNKCVSFTLPLKRAHFSNTESNIMMILVNTFNIKDNKTLSKPHLLKAVLCHIRTDNTS